MNKSDVDSHYFGQLIRQAREKAGLSQEELAQLIGRDQRAVSEYEHGKRRLVITDLAIFAKALNVPLAYFYQDQTQLSDLDYILLQEFHRLPTINAQQTAITFIRELSNLLNQ